MFRHTLRLLTLSLFLSGAFLNTARSEEPLKNVSPPLPTGAILRLGSTDLRQGERVDGLVVLNDGKHFATLSDRSLIIWDAETGRLSSSADLPPLPEGPLRGDNAQPANGGLVLLADGSALAVRDKMVTLHKLPFDKNPSVQIPQPTAEETIIATAPSVKKNAVIGFTSKGAMLEWKVGGEKWTPLDSPLQKASATVTSGGGVIAIIDDAKRIHFWDTANNKNIRTQDIDRTRILAVSADGKRYITVDPSLRGGTDIRTISDGKSITSWKVSQLARVVAFSTDGTLVAIGYSSTVEQGRNCVDIYEVATGKRQHTFSVSGGVHRLAFLPDGGAVVVDKTGLCQIWDTTTGKAKHQHIGHTGSVHRVLRTPDGGWITSGMDGAVLVWNAEGKETHRLKGHKGIVADLVLSKDGKVLYSAGRDLTVREWELSTGKELRTCIIKVKQRGFTSFIFSLALSPTGQFLAVGFTDGEIQLLETKRLTIEKSLKMKDARPPNISKVEFISDELLLSQDVERTIHFWDTGDKGDLRQVSQEHAWATQSARFTLHPDCKTIALPVAIEGFKPSLDARVPLTEVGFWDIKSGKLKGRIETETKASITTIAYLPDGKALAVGDSAGTVWVIDLEKKEPLHTFKGHRGSVLSLAVSPDGKTLSSGGADTTVLVWNLAKP